MMTKIFIARIFVDKDTLGLLYLKLNQAYEYLS